MKLGIFASQGTRRRGTRQHRSSIWIGRPPGNAGVTIRPLISSFIPFSLSALSYLPFFTFPAISLFMILLFKPAVLLAALYRR